MINKVGIMTLFYKTYNFGAQLQAYALQKAIECLGIECEQIRYKWSKLQTQRFYENCKVSKEKFEDFSLRIPHSSDIYDSSTIYNANKQYDAFVCGSDQIWGVKESMLPDAFPQMTLSFVDDKKIKIAYAGSFGSSEMDEKLKNAVAPAISRLDAVSIREQSAEKCIQKLTCNKVYTVLDPTLLVDRTQWNEVAVNPSVKEKYILTYNISNEKKIEQYAKTMATKLSLKLIDVGYLQGEEIGPREFVGLIKNAEYVITDSFHGTIFSIIYHKKFLTFGVDKIRGEYSKNVRIEDLLRTFSLADRFSVNVNEIEMDILEKEIDYDRIDNILNEKKKYSFDYLRKFLVIKEQQEPFFSVKRQTCVGCGNCKAVCAHGAIQMKRDSLGFEYPVIDVEKCTSCGSCKNVCPVISAFEVNNKMNPAVYSFSAKKEIAAISSSGGAFYELAKVILDCGGAVFGAAYDMNFHVYHRKAENIEQLEDLLRSKYVQSDLKNVFLEIKDILHVEHRKVLFCGTPCQVAALKKIIGESKLLYAIDLICGGVTSPALWDKYIVDKNGGVLLKSVNMRSKRLGIFLPDGHISFHMELQNQDGSERLIKKEDDYFLYTTVRQAFYRESCYQCEYKGESHPGDITIGDYIDFNLLYPQEDFGAGVSCVIVNTEQGKELLAKVKTGTLKERNYSSVIEHNIMYKYNLKKSGMHDFLREKIVDSSIEKIYFEAKYLELFHQKQNLETIFFQEIKRNEILEKLRLFAELELSVNDNPYVRGKVLIYGAGKVGKSLARRIMRNFEGFIDKNETLERVEGHPVYHLNKTLSKYDSCEDVTIIITPVWDYVEIEEMILQYLPNATILSVEKIVEGL